MPNQENPQLITTLPLTAEAREDLLAGLVAEELPHYGELFVPGNSFYVHGTPQARANHMAKSLCTWLGIKPGYIGLKLESAPPTSTQGQRHTIFLESHVLRDEFLLGATLAHALVRYILEERKQIHLLDPMDQLSLVATGTVVFGLGVVVANGLNPSKFHQKDTNNLLGNLPVSEYGAMLHGFLWQRGVPEHSYMNSLTPWVTKVLGAPKPTHPILAIKHQTHELRSKRYQKFGLLWIAALSLGIGAFLLVQRVRPQTGEARSLQEKIMLLQELKQVCNNSVDYTTHYSDLSDIQVVRRINAEAARCKSLQNQLHEAERSYEKTQ